MSIELGSKVRCKVTGFTGIAIARTQWLTGCMRITVQPQELDKDGKTRDTGCFDEPMLEVLSAPAKTKIHAHPQTATSPGGPRPAPARQKDVKR